MNLENFSNDIEQVAALEGFETVLGTDAPAMMTLRSYQLGPEIEQTLFQFCRELQAYNEHTNLVANAEIEVVLKEHILDSLSLIPVIGVDRLQNAELVDVGSGAGFPGIILAIACPSLSVALVESIGKKCLFLESTADSLGLEKRVQVCRQRAEILAHESDFRHTFNLATARAVASLPIVAELTLPLLKKGGWLLAQRSKRQAIQEESDADAYFSKLGGRLLDTIHLTPDLLGRELSVFKVKKESNTSSRYPRTAAQIKNEKL